jgi:phospholipid/cholesterol/gamma-HCH transport system substrate-binding protein
MDERVMQFRVGVVVLASLIITALLVLVVGVPDLVPDYFRDRYTLYVRFPQAPGVTVETPVRLNGIRIGRVTEIQPTDDDVIVTVRIDSKYTLRQNHRCVIGGGSLLGDAVLNFVRSPDRTLPDTPLKNGDTVAGVVGNDPFQLIANLQTSVDKVSVSFSDAGDQINLLAKDLRRFLDDNDEQMGRILQKSESALDKVGSAADDLSALVKDPEIKENLKRSLAEIPELVREARDASAHAREAMANLKQTLSAADRNLANLERFTEPLGRRGEGLVVHADEMMLKLGQSADKLDDLLNNLVTFSDALNNRDSSLGRLVHDPALYDNLSTAAENINRLTVEIRPVIRDARVFADKIARHPELLGVGGAVKGSSGAKPVVPFSRRGEYGFENP